MAAAADFDWVKYTDLVLHWGPLSLSLSPALGSHPKVNPSFSSTFRTHMCHAAIYSSGLQTDDLSSVWQCRKNWLDEEASAVAIFRVGQDLSGRHVGGSFMIHNGKSKVFPSTPNPTKTIGTITDF